MKTLTVAVAVAVLFGSIFALPINTQAQNTPKGIPGYLDPATGIFSSRLKLVPAPQLVRRGTITVTVNISIASPIPAKQPIECSASIFSSDNATFNNARASGDAVRSGRAGTCELSLPFLWSVQDASTTFGVDVELFTGGGDDISHSASTQFSAGVVINGSQSINVELRL